MYKFVTLTATECDNSGKIQFDDKVDIIIPIDKIIGFSTFPKVIIKDTINHIIKLENRHFNNLEIKDAEKFKSIII